MKIYNNIHSFINDYYAKHPKGHYLHITQKQKGKTMTDITTVIAELETLKEAYAERYHEMIDEYTQMNDPEDLEQNRWSRANMQGRITGINVALNMLKDL